MIRPLETLNGCKMLVVDDCLEITSLFKDVFTSCGADVVTANSAHRAIHLIRTEDFDLVVLDIVMPKLDGWRIHRLMSSARPALAQRTIFITGDRWHKEVLSQVDLQTLPVVFKPFDVAEIRAVARRVLSNRNTKPYKKAG